MIEEQVDVGVFPCFTARRRSEKVEAFDAKPSQIGY
jgi:hypothetical protein